MEYFVFGTLILLIVLAGWDLLSDIKQGNKLNQTESEFTEDIQSSTSPVT